MRAMPKACFRRLGEEKIMKKKALSCAAGALSLAMAVSMAACAKPEFEREAKAFEAPSATLTLNGKTEKRNARYQISDTLFGVFLEDINYASYALDDNLLANYSFETPQGKRSGASVTPNTYGWRAADGATFAVRENRNDGPMGSLYKNYKNEFVNGNYATVTAGATGGKLINQGYRDPAMAVEEGVEYLFSAFIRNDGAAAAELELSVKDDEQTYAAGNLTVAATDGWVKYQKTITATRSGAAGLRFELAFSGAASLSIDGVKLETKDATLGIKNYLYKAMEDLSPKFIRFPGGCVIEGVDEATAYDWKNSVGAVATGSASNSDKVPAFEYTLNEEGVTKTVKTYGEQITRRANTDIWQGGAEYYEMEYGIGFYDYFLLCEQLGASPVPVVSCGLSDQGGLQNAWGQSAHALAGRHGNKIDDYIQDALDLVCFANGSVTSSDENEAYWARVRSDMGHEEPFGLKYLGIGNEQFGNVYYEQCYRKFVEAFADAKSSNPLYGGVQLIVGNAMTLGDCEDPAAYTKGMAQKAAEKYVNGSNSVIDSVSEYGVHDQHYYVNFLDLFTNTARYDGYVRPDRDPLNYYNVFVGEYSANSVSSGGASYGAHDEWTNSWITALSEAAMMTSYERNGDIVKLAAYAPMFASLNGARQWNVDMMYFTNTDVVLTTNYYVQQLFMRHQGKYLLKEQSVQYADGFEDTYTLKGHSGRSEEISKLYYVASLDASGDIVLKIVNASGEDIDLNIALAGVKLRGVANVTVLQNDDMKAQNGETQKKIEPEQYTIGGFGKKIGYTAKKYSVTAMVIDVK